MIRAPDGVTVIGIDEMTAAVAGLDPRSSYKAQDFVVHGLGGVHVLRGQATHKYLHGELIQFH